jgi:hypothetical protein
MWWFFGINSLHQIPSAQCKLIEESLINVISLKISESDVDFPINVFGTVIARDELDYKCVYLFRRESDDPQFITSPVCIFSSIYLVVVYSTFDLKEMAFLLSI